MWFCVKYDQVCFMWWRIRGIPVEKDLHMLLESLMVVQEFPHKSRYNPTLNITEMEPGVSIVKK